MALDYAQGMLDTAGNIHHTGFFTDIAKTLTKKTCVNLARDNFVDADAALVYVLNSPAMLDLGVTAAQRDAVGFHSLLFSFCC